MMKKFGIALLAFALSFAPASAQTIDALGAGRGSVLSTDLFPSFQGASPAVRPSAAQVAAFASVTMLGTANSWSATQTFSAITLTGGSGCATFTAGVLGSTGSACGGSGSTGANPTATAGPAAVNGTASTFMRSDAAPPVQVGTAAQKGIVQVDGTTITATGGVISAPGGAVSSVSGVVGIACSPTTGTVVCSGGISDSAVSTTTYTLVNADGGLVKRFTNAAAVTVTVPAPSGFTAGYYTTIKSDGANTAGTTLTVSGTTIDGSASSIALTTNQSLDLYVNVSGTAYTTLPGRSAGSGGTITVASGTATVPATLIGSGACGSAIIVAATGVLTTDVVSSGFNADPTAVTGFLPTAMLTVVPYPTAGNVNFKACNLTASSITPTSTTFNWRVTR